RNAGLSRVRDLTEHAEVLDGLRKWIAPPDELLKHAAGENPVRALEAARWLLDRFGENLQPRIFDHWADSHSTMPQLSELCQLAVNCPRWESMLRDSYRDWVAEQDAERAALTKPAAPPAPKKRGKKAAAAPVALPPTPGDEAHFQQRWIDTAEMLVA